MGKVALDVRHQRTDEVAVVAALPLQGATCPAACPAACAAGGTSVNGRMKYYKADIALKVTGSEAEEKVKYHEPLIRNQLVELFSQQTDESLGSMDAKEKLRQEALKQVQQVLEQEEGKPYVEDLLFNNLILQ